MLSLQKLASVSRDRVTVRLKEQQQNKNPNWPGMFLSENATYYQRLVSSCHKDRFDIDELILVALPEKLLQKISYLAIGSVRANQEKNKQAQYSEKLDLEEISYLKEFALVGEDYDFSNLKGVPSKPLCIENLLLCHGLSPIGDSIVLLAELGRLFRASMVLNLPIRVMLADISWMSSNRSIRQFQSLTEKDIDNGLRICLDKRQRLYKGLELQSDLKEISFFPRINTISGKKLESISQNYSRLAKALWGEKASGRLEPKMVSSIDKPLEGLEKIEKIDETSLPEHIKTLARFPKVLQALDNHLKDHLEILRTVAKQFNSFDDEIFTYFFAQYYAQGSYKSSFLKIAPVSESKFDKPFDELHKCFSAWDDNQLKSEGNKKDHDEKLPGIYLPQYKVGKYSLLPYTPLSLDVLKNNIKDHHSIRDEIILLSENQDIEIIKKILKNTELAHRNRIISDVLSFVIMSATKTSFNIADAISKKNDLVDFESLLVTISEKLASDYKTELTALKEGRLIEMWRSWFNNIENNDPIYTPIHIHVLLLTNTEWEKENFLIGFSKMIKIATEIHNELT
jgi:hypothetical protein